MKAELHTEERNFALSLRMPADLKFIKIKLFFMITAFNEMLLFFSFSVQLRENISRAVD